MLAWYASSPEHAGTADLSLASNPQPPTSPAHHFGRPAMQSPGPPYQGSMGSAMNYSERPYENQMVSHCQTNSYPSYQPPSPYRPHPVSPPAHAHQYGAHSNHQMHSSLAYGTGHQLSPYGSSQAHYASLGTDIYGSRASMYSNSSRAMQQMKSSWGDSNGNGGATDLMQYSQPSPRPPMMPPPPIHSPSHGGMSSSVPPPPPPHYRQIPIVSPASHSPHSWSQSQIPSPGVLHPPHSPRTTPSPLPAHARSPSHSQPFSPPPPSAAPSPHQPPPSMTPHPPPQKTTPSPPSGSATPAPGPPRQPICNSPSTQSGNGGSGGNNDPLQSLQKMVMLDSETVESPITRANYEMAANQAAAAAAAVAAASAPTGPPGGPPVSSNRPSSYFSVEQLAGSDPGSPYPTYYNLDQNRLCTPPRTCMSTPTSSTFSSAPDSTSSNSPRSDSRTTTASADSSNVGHVNGDIQQQQQPQQQQQQQQQSQEPQQQPRQQTQQRRPDFPPFDVSDVRIPNGTHSTVENTGREENGPASSDSENKDTQDFLHHLGGNVPDIPPTDGTVDLSNSGRKSPKSPVDARRAYGDDIHCDPSLLDSPMDAISRNKPLLMPPDRRNSTLPEFEITNGKPEGPMEDIYPTDGGYVPRPPRYYSPTARWNKMGPLEDGFMGMQNKTYQEDYMPMPKAKRGRKKKMFAEHEGLVSEWDIYNTEITHRPARASRGGNRGRRGSRRRGGLNAYPPPNPEPNPMDMYSNDLLPMRNHHPTNGMADMMGSGGPDKNMPWSSHNYHMGPPQSITPEYCPKDTMSVIKPPMMDPHGMDGSSMNSGSMASSQAAAQNYQSDVPPVEGRGPLLFTVNKDGSTVKLQDGQMSNNNNSSVQSVNQQYYDPVLGQMIQQPMKKKRGRPFGSKNKPKPPGEERQPRRRRKKEIFFGPEGPPPPHHPKPRIINGPYVRISGIKNRALTVSVINVPPKDDDMETKYLLQKRQLQQLGNTVRQKLGLGPSNSNSPLYEMVSKDKSWLCCLCCKNSHYRGLGDLFGPYYLNGEQKPSVISAPPSPVPQPPPPDPASPSVNSFSYGQESNNSHLELHSKEEEPDQEDSRDSTLNPQRRFPGKRRSDVMEQMFRAALLRKAKQANVSLTGQKMCDGLQMGIYNPTEFPTTMPPMYPQPPPQLQLEPCEDVKGFWVHEECAIWSKGIYLFSQKVYGLEETIIEAAETICSRCKFPGASLTCAWHKCTEHYHYMCARNKWCQMNEDNYTILCPKHQELIQK